MAGKNIFNSVKMTRPKRNVFDLSHDVKLSMKFGEITPIMVTPCIPGDKFNIGCQALMRLQPTLAPVMHRIDGTIHYFFVPHRLVWPNWEKYITNTDVTPGVKAAAPYMRLSTDTNNYTKLHDYMGVPPPPVMMGIQEDINAMALASYQMVCNEYYRDQNLQTPIPFELVDGNNTSNDELNIMRLRAWEHDYFTSALPFAQKGPAVDIPIGGFENVPVRVRSGSPGATTLTGTPANVAMQADTPGGGFSDEMFAMTEDLEVEAATINDLRTAFRLQEWYEKLARGGSRYTESILSFFGVRSPDARLQRPEYITGVKSPIIMSEVENTTGTEDAPQGTLAGRGVGIMQGKYGNYFCQEHGYIIGVMTVMPKSAYMQGIPRHFTKINDLHEHYFPQFANIGEQEVLNKELYAWNGGTVGEETFGYNPRYSEYKFENNRVAGDFRTSLDFWHLARKFDSLPALNAAFIQMDPDQTTRIFAVEDNSVDKVLVHILNKVKAVRGMPKYGTPTF